MSLAEFVALLAGAVTEVLLLLGNGHRPVSVEGETVVPGPLRAVPYQTQALAVGALGLLVALALSQSGVGTQPFRWVDSAFTVAVTGVLAFILFAAVLGDRMLPRVNEQQMLVVHVLVGLNLLLNNIPPIPPAARWVLLLPTAALLFQALWPRALPLTVRAFYYFWYLATLLALAWQNSAMDLLNSVSVDPVEAFVVASLLIFLALHILVALRFVLILSSLLLPRNRPLLRLILPRLLRDEQMAPLSLLLLLVAAGSVLGLNRWLDVVPDQTVVNVLVLAVLQVGGRRGGQPL